MRTSLVPLSPFLFICISNCLHEATFLLRKWANVKKSTFYVIRKYIKLFTKFFSFLCILEPLIQSATTSFFYKIQFLCPNLFLSLPGRPSFSFSYYKLFCIVLTFYACHLSFPSYSLQYLITLITFGVK